MNTLELLQKAYDELEVHDNNAYCELGITESDLLDKIKKHLESKGIKI